MSAGTRWIPMVIVLASALDAPPALAQDGAGTTAAAVLQLLPGGRAAALSGAYVSSTADADVLFYNPAGIGALDAAAAVSYQRHVEDIGVASGAGAYRVGRVVIGAGAVFLDYGEIDELIGDPDFGGQVGQPTGRTLGASEVAARLAAALPLMDGRFRVGAGAGYVSESFAEARRSTVFFDAGAQYAVRPDITLGGSLRNIGGALSGAGLIEADLPSEARVGGTLDLPVSRGLTATVAADVVARLGEGGAGAVGGLEAAYRPEPDGRLAAMARVGYNGAAGEAGLGRLQLGGGLVYGGLALDYVYQNYDWFGSLHRFGIRWVR